MFSQRVVKRCECSMEESNRPSSTFEVLRRDCQCHWIAPSVKAFSRDCGTEKRRRRRRHTLVVIDLDIFVKPHESASLSSIGLKWNQTKLHFEDGKSCQVLEKSYPSFQMDYQGSIPPRRFNTWMKSDGIGLCPEANLVASVCCCLVWSEKTDGWDCIA